jgi:hypothetical protein
MNVQYEGKQNLIKQSQKNAIFFLINEGKREKKAYHDNNLKCKVKEPPVGGGKKRGRHADNSGNWK